MTTFRTTTAVIGAAALAAGAVLLVQANTANAAQTLRFSNTIDGPPAVLDLGAPGPSAGDSYYIGSTISSGQITGRTAASCVITSLAGAGVQQCSIDFLTPKGILSTHAVTDSARKVVRLVVVGGTGRYGGREGSGTLTPTQPGSDVVLVLS